jgi:hypothetical protein
MSKKLQEPKMHDRASSWLTLVAVFPTARGELRLMMEHGDWSRRQLAGVAAADDGARRLREGIEDGRLTLAELQVVHRGADNLWWLPRT